ncbi:MULTISPECIES: NUDIX hydrolase [unclassified Luteococcus]|uniref:NUDIX hydrolase n=1 Tax=unclassified Luteococcus TaxID=2639923 RepID=UPI00313B2A23
MGSKGKITAAGAVVLRGAPDKRQVLLVRRGTYKDWSLPKGKPEPDEDAPATAVREVHEETGVKVHLGLPVGTTRYSVGKRDKVVRWWIGLVDSERRRRPDKEVEKAVWMPVDKAMQKMSYPSEVAVLRTALELESAGTILLVRHGKAMLRKHWTGTDAKRPLASRGRRQARRICALMGAYGTSDLISSTSTRCLQTLTPYAERNRLAITGVSLLSEEEAEGHGAQVERYLADLRRRTAERGNTVAVCGHRPVIPDMRAGLGIVDAPMLTAEILVVHLDSDGEPMAIETHKCAA